MTEVAQPEVTPEAQEEPEVPEEEEIVPINVPILKLIKQQQMEHGLRHRDYNQYRRYCTNRARRLRRFLNFKLGEKRKVTPRKITPWEIKQNVQFIILMIINIEHDWSFAMELKALADDESSRKRHHMRNKLRKASKKASELIAVLSEMGEGVDARTNLETQAYCNFIMANFEFEQQLWKACLTKFEACQKIYQSLSETLPADEAGIYSDFALDLEPNVRYCQYNIDENDENLGDLLSGAKSSLTEGKLSDLLAKTKIEESENLNVTEWRGKKIAIRNEKIRVFLLNYREFQAQIDTTDLTDEEKLEKHGEIIMECGESIDLVKQELRQDPNHRPSIEKGIAPKSDLFAYLNFIRLECTIGRYTIIAEGLSKNNEYARVYEQVIQYCSEFMKKCEESGHSDLVTEIENDKMVFAAACRYYQSKQALEIGKVKEAGVLSLKASELISAVNPTNQHCKKLSAKMGQLIQSNSALIQAAILLPQTATSGAVKPSSQGANMDKDQVLRKISDFGSRFGKLEFPPKLVPVPAKPVLFDIGGNKLAEFPNLDSRVEKKKEQKKGWLGGWWGGSN